MIISKQPRQQKHEPSLAGWLAIRLARDQLRAGLIEIRGLMIQQDDSGHTIRIWPSRTEMEMETEMQIEMDGLLLSFMTVRLDGFIWAKGLKVARLSLSPSLSISVSASSWVSACVDGPQIWT